MHLKEQVQPNVEEVKQFPAFERRRNPAVPYEQREAGEVAVFQELGKALTSSLQLDQVLRTIMEKIDEFLRPDNWSLLLLDEASQELYFELAVGKASQALKDVRVRVGQGIAGWVAQNGEAVVVPDTSKDTRFFGQVDEKTKMETQSIVAVPVKFRETCLGVIELINCIGPEGFDPRDLKLLEALSDFAAIALENARHVKRIHELTITDDCTTLYNARHMSFILETEIYRSQRYNYEFSLVFIDLDHFKQGKRAQRSAKVAQGDSRDPLAQRLRTPRAGHPECRRGVVPGRFQHQRGSVASCRRGHVPGEKYQSRQRGCSEYGDPAGYHRYRRNRGIKASGTQPFPRAMPLHRFTERFHEPAPIQPETSLLTLKSCSEVKRRAMRAGRRRWRWSSPARPLSYI
jgi:putative methionine-R-sulfoxide reductase with GAF domain